MDAFPNEEGIWRVGDHKEEIYSEIYRSTWLKGSAPLNRGHVAATIAG
jgi:hypothetical protein